MDIRDYFRPGGHKPVDQSLAERTVSVLTVALEMVNRGYNGNNTATRKLSGNSFFSREKGENDASSEGKGKEEKGKEEKGKEEKGKGKEEKGKEEDSGVRDGVEKTRMTVSNTSSALKNEDNKSSSSHNVADGAVDKEVEKEVEYDEDEEWKLSSSVAGDFVRVKRKGDVVSGALKLTTSLNHLLGPMRDNQESECKVSVLQLLRDEIGSKEEHCAFCSPATRRYRSLYSLYDVGLEEAYSP